MLVPHRLGNIVVYINVFPFFETFEVFQLFENPKPRKPDSYPPLSKWQSGYQLDDESNHDILTYMKNGLEITRFEVPQATRSATFGWNRSVPLPGSSKLTIK